MAPVPPGYELRRFQTDRPMLWVAAPRDLPHVPDASDEVMAKVFGNDADTVMIKSWGADDRTVHWLATRSGTGMHHDIGYTRYTHQLNIRNDGFRTGGYDPQDDLPPLLTGVMACLDTWSPHKVRQDDRIIKANGGRKPRYKVQLVLDYDQPLTPDEVWAFLSPRLAEVTVADGMAWAPPGGRAPGYRRVKEDEVPAMSPEMEARWRAFMAT